MTEEDRKIAIIMQNRMDEKKNKYRNTTSRIFKLIGMINGSNAAFADQISKLRIIEKQYQQEYREEIKNYEKFCEKFDENDQALLRYNYQ